MRMLQMGVLGLSAIVLAGPASAVTITFDEAAVGLVHGSVVTTQYSGLTISAVRTGGTPRPAVAFDTGLTGTADVDLEFGNGWDRGNLSAPPVPLENILILNENTTGCADNICNSPDDEGNRPAGSLFFDFSDPVLSFGFDLVDIENTSLENGAIVFSGGGKNVTITMATFLAGFQLGDNSANRVQPFTAAGLGLSGIDLVELRLGGSGGIDNLVYDVVPEPSTIALLGLGLAAVSVRSRARRR